MCFSYSRLHGDAGDSVAVITKLTTAAFRRQQPGASRAVISQLVILELLSVSRFHSLPFAKVTCLSLQYHALSY